MNYKSDFADKQVLVTGGLGFIGSNLVIELIKLGAEVTYTGRNFDLHCHKIPENIRVKAKFVEWDVNDNFPLNVPTDWDFVFHLAGQTSHSASLIDPINDINVNLIATIRLLELLKKNDFKGRFIYTSTKGVTGIPKILPVTEISENNPLDIYSVNKLAIEHYLDVYKNHSNIDYTILRVTNVYGPRQQISSPSKGILNFFIGQALQNKPITIFGDGNQLRDYTYIDDCIKALLILAISKKSGGTTFYLGSGVGIKFKHMAEAIIEILGNGETIFKEYPIESRKIEIGDFIVDSSKLREIGWEPNFNFKNGLRATCDFYKTEMSLYIDN